MHQPVLWDISRGKLGGGRMDRERLSLSQFDAKKTTPLVGGVLKYGGFYGGYRGREGETKKRRCSVSDFTTYGMVTMVDLSQRCAGWTD